MNFEDLQLAPALVRAVHELGYTQATPIQTQAIPAVLSGQDILAGAQTGTGKTAAFLLPILDRLHAQAVHSTPSHIRALVLTPTRELAAQVDESAKSYGKYMTLRSTAIFGGVGMRSQIEQIERGLDVLVATPGRLLDLEQQGHIDLSKIEFLVLDEADRMLDMGFIHDVKKVLALLPGKQQSLLFSATFSDDIRALAKNLLKDPQNIQVTPSNTTVQRIAQVIHPVGREQKKTALLHIIQTHNWSQVLVFTRTKFGANQVAHFLTDNGVAALALHGNKSQTARTQALSDFKSGVIRALVATDIAARGIDIEDLPHVVNYEIPNVPEDYVHRIGRTGRAGAEGAAVSLVCMDEEGFMHAIERFIKQEIPVQMLEGFGPSEGEKAEPIAMGRQTLWGGLGPMPSKEVMQAAAKAARQEMFERIRTHRAKGHPKADSNGQDRGGRPARADRTRRGPAPAGRPPSTQDGLASDSMQAQDLVHSTPLDGGPNSQTGESGNGFRNGNGGRRTRGGRNKFRTDSRGRSDRPRSPPAHPEAASRNAAPRSEGRPQRDGDELPRHINPLMTNQFASRPKSARPAGSRNGGQPDPTRTSIDSLASSGKRRGGGGGGGYRGY